MGRIVRYAKVESTKRSVNLLLEDFNSYDKGIIITYYYLRDHYKFHKFHSDPNKSFITTIKLLCELFILKNKELEKIIYSFPVQL